MPRKVVNITYGWDRTSVHEKMVTLFDPCAGEGTFLSAMVRQAKQAAATSHNKNTTVVMNRPLTGPPTITTTTTWATPGRTRF